ncbi:DUF7344 domain-containing protein [Haloprofundus salinisoli]|uniref:DUF7344 domain-containing protein n=1 Tax=Haloprofundus salinisoli TaxID=2876193 RepID=UPI001CC92AA6|nr:hypothetical protein [Haloprofundus salinisoli]
MHLLKHLISVLRPSNHTSSATTPSVSPSEAYALLANERRRVIIAYLADMDMSTTDAGEIADYLSSIGDDRTPAYISCIQVQLPRMAKAGLIDYDERQKTVRPLAPLDTVYEVDNFVEHILR